MVTLTALLFFWLLSCPLAKQGPFDDRNDDGIEYIYVNSRLGINSRLGTFQVLRLVKEFFEILVRYLILLIFPRAS